MGGDAGEETSDGMGTDGFADKVAVAEAVEHGSVGGKVAAPAHAHGGKDGDGIVVDNAFRDETGDKTEGSTDGAKGGDGEGNEGTRLEAKEPFEHYVDFVGQHGNDGDTFVGGAGILAMFTRRTKGEHHDDGGNAENAGNNGKTDVDTFFTTVEDAVEKTLEDAAFALIGYFLFVAFGGAFNYWSIHFRIALEGETLHETGGDDTADERTENAHRSTTAETLAYHESKHHTTHAEGGAEIGEGDKLVFLKILREVFVVGKGDDGGVVGEECHDCTKGGDTGQVVKRFHEGTQDVLHQTDNAELDEQFAYTAHQNTDSHDVEDGFEQELVGSLHEGVEHVGEGHAVGKNPEESHKENQEQDSLDGAFAGELERVLDFKAPFNSAKEFFGPVGILGGFVFTVVV